MNSSLKKSAVAIALVTMIAWYAAVSVIGGMILVFGAPAIVDSLAGSL